MNRQICSSIEQEQWRVNLIELKHRTGMSSKQIAERENLSEKSVARVFSGEAKSPGVDLIHRIIHALGGTWSDVFAESDAVIGSQDLSNLQGEVDRLTSELCLLQAEIAVMKDKVSVLTSENEFLRMKLEHKDELLALHNYSNKLKTN